jgi:hypothetical protein
MRGKDVATVMAPALIGVETPTTRPHRSRPSQPHRAQKRKRLPVNAIVRPKDDLFSDVAWWTLRTGARYADCSEKTLSRWIKMGALRAARIGPGAKAIRIKRQWLDEALVASMTPREIAR